MIKNTLLFAALGGILFFWTTQLHAMFGSVEMLKGDVVVLELFTSQSCSSCPPADRLLGELAERDNVIALSCHVTYWNHLHWEDTLSQSFCTERQRAYSHPLGERGSIYTPQMVVNGAAHAVGSRPGSVNSAINSTKSPRKIHIQRQNNALMVNFPALEASKYTISLFGIQKSHTQGIKRGENRGRTVTYTHAVTYMEQIEAATTRLDQFTLTPQHEAEGYIILVQDPKTMQVLAAGQVL